MQGCSVLTTTVALNWAVWAPGDAASTATSHEAASGGGVYPRGWSHQPDQVSLPFLVKIFPILNRLRVLFSCHQELFPPPPHQKVYPPPHISPPSTAPLVDWWWPKYHRVCWIYSQLLVWHIFFKSRKIINPPEWLKSITWFMISGYKKRNTGSGSACCNKQTEEYNSHTFTVQTRFYAQVFTRFLHKTHSIKECFWWMFSIFRVYHFLVDSHPCWQEKCNCQHRNACNTTISQMSASHGYNAGRAFFCNWQANSIAMYQLSTRRNYLYRDCLCRQWFCGSAARNGKMTWQERC